MPRLGLEAVRHHAKLNGLHSATGRRIQLPDGRPVLLAINEKRTRGNLCQCTICRTVVDEELKMDRPNRATTNFKAVRFVDSLRLDQARRREQKGDDVTSAHTCLWEQVQ